MKRGLSLLLLSILIVGFLVAGVDSNLDKVDKVERNVLDKVRSSDEGRVRVYISAEDADELGVDVRHRFDDDKVSAIVSEDELEDLNSNPDVESVELVGTRSIALQDSVPLINGTSAWSLQLNSINLTGLDETICIIDTGINYTHPDLGGAYGNNSDLSLKVIGGIDYCADDVTCTTTDEDPIDVEGHGTHVAGIAAANGTTKGVAPEAKIIMIKAANRTGVFFDDDLEKAINWCNDNRTKFNISVISMSLGGGLYTNNCDSDALTNEINSAVGNNISVVVASGNSGSTTQINGPACVTNATPVGGSTKADGMYSSGNRNALVQLVAPGVNINSTSVSADSTTGYVLKTGTSMSTPHVAGAIAILNQFKRLENGKNLTPQQIEDAFNDSGKIIYDSGTGLNFSRIDIYNTVLAQDETSPNLTINLPVNNHVNQSTNQIFECNSSDALQLSNITFAIWNSSSGSLVNRSTYSASSNILNSQLNISLANGTYTWNCESYDAQGNLNITSNRSISIGNILVTLSDPANSNITDVNNTNFTCAVDSVNNITNVTFFLWNSTSNLTVEDSVNISGKNVTNTFNANLSSDGAHLWNCQYTNNDSEISYASSNFTITRDRAIPSLSSLSPSNNSDEEEDTSVTFKVNASDTSGIANCSLVIDGSVDQTDISITNGALSTFTKTFSTDGNRTWFFNCTDNLNYHAASAERNIEITEASSSGGSSSGGSSSGGSGGGAVTPFYGTVTDTDISAGVQRLVLTGSGLKFNVKGEAHNLTIKSSTVDSVKIDFYSTLVTKTIDKGKSERINLDDDKTYDLEVTYIEKLLSDGAKIFLRSIDIPIETKEISNETTSNETTTDTDEQPAEEEDGETSFSKINKKALIIAFIVVVGSLGVAIFLFFEREEIMDFIQRHKKGSAQLKAPKDIKKSPSKKKKVNVEKEISSFEKKAKG